MNNLFIDIDGVGRTKTLVQKQCAHTLRYICKQTHLIGKDEKAKGSREPFKETGPSTEIGPEVKPSVLGETRM